MNLEPASMGRVSTAVPSGPTNTKCGHQLPWSRPRLGLFRHNDRPAGPLQSEFTIAHRHHTGFSQLEGQSSRGQAKLAGAAIACERRSKAFQHGEGTGRFHLNSLEDRFGGLELAADQRGASLALGRTIANNFDLYLAIASRSLYRKKGIHLRLPRGAL